MISVSESLRLHLFFMTVAFAVFSISFLVGSLYLWQESQLKRHATQKLLSWLPALETMDSFHYKILILGFLLLSGGIFSGALLSHALQGRFFSDDPRQLASLVTWALYAFFLNVRLQAGWRGRKGMILSILGFLGVILAFIGLGHRL